MSTKQKQPHEENLLGKKELKSFKFQLKNHKRKGFNCIPRSKLEDKDTVDIATLVTDHYGCTEALGVTRDVLSKINQRALVSELESYTGKKSNDCDYKVNHR
uniref:Pyrin domain-containing protein n=1 Tax=Anabas testudineus TaxID=64144 RepID=A0A3Q1HGX8_ANATE